MVKKSITFKGQTKPYGKSGHFNESKRHSLQAKGIKTGNLAKSLPMVNQKIFATKTARDGTQFKIQETGMNWTLYVKEKGSSKWERIQSCSNALLCKQIMNNQKEFRDTDGDGVPDHKDCDPNDPTKQDKTKFKSFNEFKKYVKQGKGLPDVVEIGKKKFTMDFYDMSGELVTYGNKKYKEGIEVHTSNRYNKGYADADVVKTDDPLFRNDISYEE